MRDQLRDLIAERIAAEHRRRAAEQIADSPEGHARAFADAVMELFPEVEKQGRDAAGGWLDTAGWTPLATRWVARTTPEETPHAQ